MISRLHLLHQRQRDEGTLERQFRVIFFFFFSGYNRSAEYKGVLNPLYSASFAEYVLHQEQDAKKNVQD